MATTFDTILTRGVREGQIPARTDSARNWYRDAAGQRRRINERSLINSETSRFKSRMRIGDMYMFYYDPKHKETLPYYDRFPLVFPIKKAEGGFLGLNMHYLPLPLRARLMDALYDLSLNQRYDETTRLRLNYDVLNSAAKFRLFKPCIKHYLMDHMDSRFWYVYPSEWDIALFLPLERFKKANKRKVQNDSRRMIQGR
jgi:hypothetical protein